ncbi:PKD domain-containing protein [Natrinema gelatinilyticum]|uniref:PKD domain-containing protein n=1 Tax=Natrinema gelatinilyticum TaxID=2961571 RepID=UPI0020C1E84F|nr:PKD domain-containing protein [Natrinema gelatinilyticum]
MDLGHTRRDILKISAAGTVLGAGLVGNTASAMAAGAPFGDGVNLQPSYFCGGTGQDIGWDLMEQYPAVQTVRIEIEPFSFGDVDTTVEDARRWIDEAAENGYEVIATYHHDPDNGSANPSALQRAADFWVDHYGTLSQNSSFAINLMNEWGDHSVSASAYASAYTDAIGTVRTDTSYTGPLVCDAPGWGQGTHRLARAVEHIDDGDLILSAHVYPSGYNATTGESLQPIHLDVMDETDYPCMIGEFGTDAGTAGADWSAIVDHAKALGWPVIAWAWNGDGTAERMNMADPYWGDACHGPYSESSYFAVVYDKLGDGSGSGEIGGSVEPTATITPGATDPSVGETMSFDASGSSDGDGTVERYEWTFSDGTTMGERVEHAFDEPGEYEVLLTVTDDAEAAASDAVAITVSAESDPGVPANLGIVATTATAITLEWGDVDGVDRYVVSVDGSADHETSETSTTIDGLEPDTRYEIAVVDGDAKSVTKTISVATEKADGVDERVNAEIQPSTTSPSVGERVGFNAVETAGKSSWITELAWALGDGTTASGWWNAHTYDSPGTYTVALTATDNEGIATTHEIGISVRADGTVGDDRTDGRSRDDGATDDDGSDSGDAADEYGRSTGNGESTDGLNAEVRPSTTSPSVGERVGFNVVDTTDRNAWITALRWDLGDGTTASGWYIAYAYDSPGTYTVALTATDSEGTTTTHEIKISVLRYRRRRPAFPSDRPIERENHHV